MIRAKESVLAPLFTAYCFEAHKPLSQRRLREGQYLQFARDVKICPGLLPRVEALQLFRAMTSEVGTVPEWNRQAKGEVSLTYGDFCACCAATAAVVFAGEEWKARSFAQKLEMLIFWLKQHTVPKKATFKSDNKVSLIEAPTTGATTYALDVNPPGVPPPSRAELLQRLRRLFASYCARGDRLNVGPAASLSRLQCVRLLERCGCLSSRRLRERVDVTLASRRDRRLDFDGLVALLETIAPEVLGRRKNNGLGDLLETVDAAGLFDLETQKKEDRAVAHLLPQPPRKTSSFSSPKKEPEQAVFKTPPQMPNRTRRQRSFDQPQETDLKSGLSSPRDDFQTEDAWPVPHFRVSDVKDDVLPEPDDDDEPLGSPDVVQAAISVGTRRGESTMAKAEARATSRSLRSSLRSSGDEPLAGADVADVPTTILKSVPPPPTRATSPPPDGRGFFAALAKPSSIGEEATREREQREREQRGIVADNDTASETTEAETRRLRLATSTLESIATSCDSDDSEDWRRQYSREEDSSVSKDVVVSRGADDDDDAPPLASLVDAISRSLSATSVAGVPLVNASRKAGFFLSPLHSRRRTRKSASGGSSRETKTAPPPFGYDDGQYDLFFNDEVTGRKDDDESFSAASTKSPASEQQRLRREENAICPSPEKQQVLREAGRADDDDDVASSHDRRRTDQLRALEAALVEQSVRLAALQDRITASAPTSPEASAGQTTRLPDNDLKKPPAALIEAPALLVEAPALLAETTPAARDNKDDEDQKQTKIKQVQDQDRIRHIVPVEEPVDRESSFFI